MTTLTKDDALEFRGMRVDVRLRDSAGPPLTGVLRFVTPTDHVILADPDGRETELPLDLVWSIADARFPCDRCGPDALYNYVFVTRDDEPRTLCADHYREWASAQPAPIMICDRCTSGAQAFYSPRTKVFACAACQGMGKGLTGLGVEARFLAVQNAACRAQPLDDERHRWMHVRGSRFHCTLCDAKRFTEPPLGTLAPRTSQS